MKFKPGDQVSFVNEKGGGMVLAITKNGSYRIALEDGFDLVMSERELALVKGFQGEPPLSVNTGQTDIIEPETKNGIRIQTPADEIAFCIVPDAENRVLSGGVSFFLSNQTTLLGFVIVSYIKAGRHFLIADRRLEPGDEIELGSFSRHDLTDWECIHIQLMLFGRPDFKFIRPVHREIPVLLPDLQNSTADKGRFAFARQLSVFRISADEPADIGLLREKFSPDTERPVARNKDFAKRKPVQGLNDERYGIYRIDKEIDLHIGCLVDDQSQQDAVEILNLQLNCFRKEMDRALLQHYHSITFIHGIGEGKLKKAIIDELQNYTGVSWRPAPFEKYGAGALEVLLK